MRRWLGIPAQPLARQSFKHQMYYTILHDQIIPVISKLCSHPIHHSAVIFRGSLLIKADASHCSVEIVHIRYIHLLNVASACDKESV